jgi:hypothetical protein
VIWVHSLKDLILLCFWFYCLHALLGVLLSLWLGYGCSAATLVPAPQSVSEPTNVVAPRYTFAPPPASQICVLSPKPWVLASPYFLCLARCRAPRSLVPRLSLARSCLSRLRSLSISVIAADVETLSTLQPYRLQLKPSCFGFQSFWSRSQSFSLCGPVRTSLRSYLICLFFF